MHLSFTSLLLLISASVVLTGLTAVHAEDRSARPDRFPPLCLHPENPHYLLFRGKPTVLLTSGEHYGAVLNLDFDYVRYLDALARDGLNGTRTWAGAYCEPTTAFQIAQNTLAP